MSIRPPWCLSLLRRSRLEAGLTLAELARATGLTTTKLSAAERGRVELTHAERRAIAIAFGSLAAIAAGEGTR
jgi:transcriptional regulator with XRE-family HTH domain